MTLDFQLPDLWKSKVLLFKPPSLSYIVMVAQANTMTTFLYFISKKCLPAPRPWTIFSFSFILSKLKLPKVSFIFRSMIHLELIFLFEVTHIFFFLIDICSTIGCWKPFFAHWITLALLLKNNFQYVWVYFKALSSATLLYLTMSAPKPHSLDHGASSIDMIWCKSSKILFCFKVDWAICSISISI